MVQARATTTGQAGFNPGPLLALRPGFAINAVLDPVLGIPLQKGISNYFQVKTVSWPQLEPRSLVRLGSDFGWVVQATISPAWLPGKANGAPRLILGFFPVPGLVHARKEILNNYRGRALSQRTDAVPNSGFLTSRMVFRGKSHTWRSNVPSMGRTLVLLLSELDAIVKMTIGLV